MEKNTEEVSDLQVLQAIVKYCAILVSIPILSFFVVKNVLLDGLFRMDSVTSNVYSALVAVVVLHIALGAYIYKAYFEADKAPKPVKAD